MSLTPQSGLLGVSSQTSLRRAGLHARAPARTLLRIDEIDVRPRPAPRRRARRSAQYITPRRDGMSVRAEAEEQRDRRRHARAEDERRGGAFERADHRLGFAHGRVVGPAVDRRRCGLVVGIADEGRRDMHRRHERARRFVDAAERLGGERARAPVLGRRSQRQAPQELRRVARRRPPPSPISSAFERRRAIDQAQPEIARQPQRPKSLENSRFIASMPSRWRDVEAAGALIAASVAVARIEAEPHSATIASASAATSRRPRLRPCPASG